MQIVFRGCAPLIIEINDTPLAHRWLDMVRRNLRNDPNPIFRDPQKYTAQLLGELARQAHDELGWNWDTSDLSLLNTTRMHKDIESYLSRGFESIPEHLDTLLHDIHFCLHSVESGSKRQSWLQIEWFNDDWEPISDAEYPAKIHIEFGDIRLQNPYVGHHPLYIWQQNDRHDVMQTCRFHDRLKPGILMVVEDEPVKFDWDRYLSWWHRNAAEFVQTHGEHRLKTFTGHPVIGRVINLDDLKHCVQQPVLELDRVILD